MIVRRDCVAMHKQRLIIVTDLGLLRAYREVKGAANRPPHLELIDELRPASAHERLSEQVSDQAGRFPRGAGDRNISGDLSAGERHDLETEQERRLLQQMAGRINRLLGDDSVTACSLAVSEPIHKQLLNALDGAARTKIEKVIPANLVKVEPAELRAHFQGA
jgi:hypothetical protein